MEVKKWLLVGDCLDYKIYLIRILFNIYKEWGIRVYKEECIVLFDVCVYMCGCMFI